MNWDDSRPYLWRELCTIAPPVTSSVLLERKAGDSSQKGDISPVGGPSAAAPRTARAALFGEMVESATLP